MVSLEFEIDQRFKRNLTAAEEAELATRIGQGDHAARDKLINHNLRLASTSARRLMRQYSRFATEIHGAALVGLVEAADTFDPAKGRFSNHATWQIRKAVDRWFRYEYHLIRLPGSHLRANSGHKLASEAFCRDSERARRCVAVGYGPKSDRVPFDMPGQLSGIEIEERTNFSGPLTTLTTRERTVIERRFGLTGDSPETLTKIGADLGVTKECVRQTAVRALAKLRAAMGEEAASA